MLNLFGTVKEKVQRGFEYARNLRDSASQDEEKYFDVIYIQVPRTVRRGELFHVKALNSFILPIEELEAASAYNVVHAIELEPRTLIEDMYLTASTQSLTVEERPGGFRYVSGSNHALKEWLAKASVTGKHELKIAWRIDGVDHEKLLPVCVAFNHPQFLKWAIAASLPVIVGMLATAFRPELGDGLRVALTWIQTALGR